MSVVLLSASIPKPERDPQYWVPERFLNIREAVRALARVVLPRGYLVFGGHPAITPLIHHISGRLGGAAREHVVLFLSRLFEKQFPREVEDFPHLVVTEAAQEDADASARLEASLQAMREAMIATGAPAVARRLAVGTESIDAAFFIGGMEGVEAEYDLFREHHPDAPAYPVVSAGAAGSKIFEAEANRLDPEVAQMLQEDLAYGGLFGQLLGLKLTQENR